MTFTITVYDYLGCWKDNGLFPKIGFLKLNDRVSLVHQCAKAAASHGISVFGIKKNSVCVGSVHASFTYMRYGPSAACYNGTGGPRSMDVYSLEGKARVLRFLYATGNVIFRVPVYNYAVLRGTVASTFKLCFEQ